MSEEIIWVMDSDLCEYCDALLDIWGNCPTGCDLIEFDDCDLDEADVYDLDFDENGKYIGG